MAEITGRVGWRTFVPTNNPLWDNLLAYWSGDNTANDAKGTYNGTLVNGATYSTGKINNGFSLDGVNDYVDLGLGYRQSKTEPFTYNFWASINSLGTLTVLSNSGDNGHFCYIESGYIWMQIGFSGGGYLRIRSTSTIPLNTLKHITITYDGSASYTSFKIYINGVSNTVVGSTNTLGSYDTPNPSAYNLNIGRRPAGQYYFSGILDEVSIWNRVLTAAEATELYNAGAGKQYVAPTPTYTTRTAAFAIATGITDTTILNALNTFDTGLISNGLDTDLEALYPFVGGTSTTHQYNFMNPINSDAAFRLTFNGGWVHSSTGALPNGSNAYAKTWWNPATQITGTIDNGSFGFYIRQELLAGGGQETLFCSNGSSYFGMWGGANAIYPSLNDANAISFNPTNKKGFFQVSRTSTSNIISSVGTQQFSQTQNTNSKTNAWVSLGAWHEITTGYDRLIEFSSKEISMAYLSKGKYTQAQQSTLYTLTQALQTSLGRQV